MKKVFAQLLIIFLFIPFIVLKAKEQKKESSFYLKVYTNQKNVKNKDTFKNNIELHQLGTFYSSLLVDTLTRINDTTHIYKQNLNSPKLYYLAFSNGKIIEVNGEYISLKTSYPIFAENSDSLVIHINQDELGKFNHQVEGCGKEKTNFFFENHEIEFDLPKNIWQLPINKALDLVDKKYIEQYKRYEKYRINFSKEFQEFYTAQIFYNSILEKHSLSVAHINSKNLNIKETKKLANELFQFMATTNISNEKLLLSRYYEIFLYKYLEYLHLISQGYDQETHPKDSYELASIIYKGNIRKHVLYQFVSSIVKDNDFNKYAEYINDFLDEYPNTKEAKEILTLYNQNKLSLVNQAAPNVALTDIFGRKINPAKCKGKVVLLSIDSKFINYSLDEPDAYIWKIGKTGYEKFVQICPKDIIVIRLESEKSQNLKKSFNRENTYLISYKKLPDELKSFYYINGRSNYIIGKDGKIVKRNFKLSPAKKWIKSIEKHHSKHYNIFTSIGNFINNNSRILLVTFIFAFTIAILITFDNKRKQATIQLENDKINSDLKAIRAQLNPHFIFNSLNSLQNFINKSDKKAANEHLSKFASLMRRVLEYSKEQSISLHEEIEFIRTYLSLEAIRHQFKLDIHVDQILDLHNIDVPPLLSQPFIENAILHGVSGMGNKGKIELLIQNNGNKYITIIIRDNGEGCPKKVLNNANGNGLKLSAERFAVLNKYQKDFIHCDVRQVNTNGGCEVTLRILID